MVNYTTNVYLAKPLNSSFVGTWDVPVNSNMDIVDSLVGGSATISPLVGATTLSTAQFQTNMLIFTSSLTGNCTINFPAGLAKSFSIYSQVTNSSLYTITLQVTGAPGQVICCPPNEVFDIITDGTNVRFRNFGRVGEFLDYAGSSVPIWVSGCTVPPYLNCDGTSFSSATYPALATLIGTTLPDSRGRFRATLNQGQSRITSGSSTGGVDGNTNFASGGSQTTTLSSQNIPPVPITDPGHSHLVGHNDAGSGGGGGPFVSAANPLYATNTNTTGITAGSTSPTNFSNIPPTYIGGITMIRAA